MAIPLRVLIVEDSADDAALVLRELHRGGYEVSHQRVDSPGAMNAAVDGGQWDLVICDYSMPHFSGMDALRLQRSKNLEVPFIFLSGTIGEETAVAALKEGAQDYLMKNNLKRLVPTIQRELREAEQRRERKVLEKELQNLQKFEAIGRLAGGITHDFNNALGVILGWAQLGYEEAVDGSPARGKFGAIRDQAERAAKLTSQLLAFARNQVLRRQAVDLNELVMTTSNLLRSVIEKQIAFSFSLQEDLPSIHADPVQLDQVLVNLCLNARDAMPQGGQIHFKTQVVRAPSEDAKQKNLPTDAGSYVLLSVSDTGMGMDGATLDRIFEPFFTTKESGKGTGLGLATVYGIVQQHGGFVDVRSEVGLGTTFNVHLPAEKGNHSATTSTAAAQGILKGTETLLVAEDQPLLRQLAYESLRALGYNIILASDGYEAVRLFEENSDWVHLAILDFMMPGISGAEALSRMRDIRPDLPAIFTTGYIVASSEFDPKLIQGTRFLQKPYRPETLGGLIREVLDVSKTR